jgi:hypothetical protein
MVDERFAYVTLEDGRKFQVLRFVEDPETGDMVPVDWDEAATAALINTSRD